MHALVVQGKGAAQVEQVDTPKASGANVLIRVHNVALNPTDWKHLDFFGVKGATLGSDFVGTVVEKGPDDKSDLAVGTRVAGMVHGGYEPGTGAFANYLRTLPHAVTRVPDNVPDEQAAGLGVAGYTAYAGLFQEKHLGIQPPSPTLERVPPVNQSNKLLVWSGSTSVGQFVVQFARAAGYYVIATASPNNHELLKSLGASEVFDYRDEKTPEKIAEAHPDLVYAYDTYSEKGSNEACGRALSKTQPSKLVAILPLSKDLHTVNDKVKATVFLGYTFAHEEINMFGLSFSKEYCQEDQKFLVQFVASGVYSNLLRKGIVKPNRTSPQSGGLDSIPAGLDRLRKGQVSGEKLTYKV